MGVITVRLFFFQGCGVTRMYFFPEGTSLTSKPLGNSFLASSSLTDGMIIHSPPSYTDSGKWSCSQANIHTFLIMLPRNHHDNKTLNEVVFLENVWVVMHFVQGGSILHLNFFGKLGCISCNLFQSRGFFSLYTSTCLSTSTRIKII